MSCPFINWKEGWTGIPYASLSLSGTNHILLKQYLNLQHYLNAPITLRFERIVGFLNPNGEA
jgi:hypothetical protein